MAAATTLAPVTLPHHVDEVTVYREGARVRRVMALEGGAEEVRFGGLPLGLDDGSVRVLVLEGEGLTAADARVGLEVPELDAELGDAEDEALRAARLASDRCKHDVVRLEQALVRLEGLKIGPRPAPRENEPPLAIPLEGRKRLVELRLGESERVARELADARVRARDGERKLTEEVERHRRATTARNAKRHELRKAVSIRLEGTAKGPAKLAIEYLVPGACWSPSYALVLDHGKARLTMRALVAQRTGESWKGVRLVLSTAQADRWVELPELPKARIGRAQLQARKRGYREPPEGAGALYADYDRVAGGPSEAGETDETDETTPIQLAAVAPEEPQQSLAVTRAATISRSAPMLADHVAALAPPAPRRAGGLAGAFGRVAAAALPAASAGPAPGAALMQAKRMASAELGEHDGLLDEMAASEPEGAAARMADWEADGESLAYGRLRMRGPDDPARGELVAIATAQVYVEQLGGRLVAGVSVSAMLAGALEGAEIDRGALPGGHSLAMSEDSYDYAYAAELPADVPSDGAFHTLAVASYETESAVRYVAVPREGQQVFRLLDLESPLDGALLAGPLDVYEGEGDGELSYRTTTRMPQTPPRGRVEIGLGTEPAIKLARTTSFQEETAGLLGGSLALVHHVGVELRNLLPRAVTVEVRERVPVVRKDDADVKVEIGHVEPPWERWDQEQTLRGGYRWKVALEPGQSRNLSARYTIKISSKLELAGGNRRES
jgi:hypothetical protein